MNPEKYRISFVHLFWGLAILSLWITGIIITPLIANISPFASDYLYFLYKPVCHQLIHRSFIIDDLPLAVCIRCTSFYGAGLVVFFVYLVKKKISFWNASVYFVLISPGIIDFFLEKMGVYNDIVLIRIATGLMMGIAFFQLFVLSLSHLKLNRMKLSTESR